MHSKWRRSFKVLQARDSIGRVKSRTGQSGCGSSRLVGIRGSTSMAQGLVRSVANQNIPHLAQFVVDFPVGLVSVVVVQLLLFLPSPSPSLRLSLLSPIPLLPLLSPIVTSTVIVRQYFCVFAPLKHPQYLYLQLQLLPTPLYP